MREVTELMGVWYHVDDKTLTDHQEAFYSLVERYHHASPEFHNTLNTLKSGCTLKEFASRILTLAPNGYLNLTGWQFIKTLTDTGCLYV